MQILYFQKQSDFAEKNLIRLTFNVQEIFCFFEDPLDSLLDLLFFISNYEQTTKLLKKLKTELPKIQSLSFIIPVKDNRLSKAKFS